MFIEKVRTYTKGLSILLTAMGLLCLLKYLTAGGAGSCVFV